MAADMALDTSPFESTVARLDEGLARYRKDVSDAHIRDGLVQRFEFTYELSHKMIKRWLEQASATPGQYDTMPFADLVRSANEAGLLRGDWPRWKIYRDMRGRAIHTYKEAIAMEAVHGIPDFLLEAIHLRDELKRRAS